MSYNIHRCKKMEDIPASIVILSPIKRYKNLSPLLLKGDCQNSRFYINYCPYCGEKLK